MKMLDVSLYDLGIDTVHAPDVVIDRPMGMKSEVPRHTFVAVPPGELAEVYDCYLVTCFRTPFFYLTANGIEYGVPGDCVIHDPVSPQRHGPLHGAKEGFRNDWIHVHGSDLPRLLEACELPINTLIPTGRADLIANLLRNMMREVYSQHPFWQLSVTGYIYETIIRIARHHSMQVKPDDLTSTERALKAKLVDVRMRIHDEFHRRWTVESMAELVCLSSSRFSHLYYKFFGISPIEDMMQRRVEHAAHLLSGTSSSVSEVCHACGFDSPNYFSRAFRRRMGCTPSEYALSQRTPGEK